MALKFYSILIIISLSSGTGLSADPVYTPATLNDSAGNQADENSDVTWAALPTGSPYLAPSSTTSSGGMKSFYDLTRSFINTIFPQNIPTDIVKNLADGNTAYIMENYSQYTSFYIGYGTCIAIGLLFIVFFPLVACCFCCCRCCDNCGGKMFQEEEDAKNNCKRNTYIFIQLIILAFIATGMAFIYVNNERTKSTIGGVSDTVSANLDDIGIYVNNTVAEAKHVVTTNFDFMKTAVERDLDNIGYLVGIPLRTHIETNTGLPATFTSAHTLSTKLTNASTALDDIDTKLGDLRTALGSLGPALTQSKNNIDAALTTCGASCIFDTSSLTVNIDTSNFPNLTAQETAMNTAVSSDISTKITNAENTFNDIPNTVTTDAATAVADMKTMLNDVKANLDPVTNNINLLSDTVYGSDATINIEKLKADVDAYVSTAIQYDRYRWYGGLGLASIVLLVTFLGIVGLTCGICGRSNVDTTQRGSVSHHGGNMMMASAVFIFIFSSLLMLLTFFTFLIGAPVERFICKPIVDPSFAALKTLVDDTLNDVLAGEGKYYFGKLLANNNTTPITLTGLLRNCKDGQTVYNAFHLSTRFDLNSTLDYSKTLDISAEVAKVNVDLSTVEIYPQALSDQLTEMKNGVNVNFSAFRTELNNGATPEDLTTSISNLEDYINSLGTSTTLDPAKAALTTEKASLETIETNQYAAVTNAVDALKTSLDTMESVVAGVPALIDTIDTNLTAAQTFIQTGVSSHISTLLTDYVTRVKKIPDSFVTYTFDAMFNKMGKCNLIWNLWDSLMVKTLCYGFVDVLNGFWFSLGWCILFFMPSLIFSVKLAKHFRRMDSSDHYDSSSSPKYSRGLDGPSVGPGNAKFNSSMHKLRNNKVEHRDDW